jgi:N-acylneuraminate cytidylyltransferase
MSKFVALVPLRGGSKSIPDKNIKPIAGKPLCAWTLEAATACGLFDRVIASTDSSRIAEVVRGLDLGVEILKRPVELATDTASTEAVMLHLAEQVDFDVLVTLQATSPLTSAEDLLKAWEIFVTTGCDSLLTAVRVKRFIWSHDAVPLNYDPLHRPRRQDFVGTLMENGAFYFTRRSLLEQTGCRLGGKTGIYEMPPETAVEIDEPEDWSAVEQLLARERHTGFWPGLADLQLLVVDVDGTLTDAGMYYAADGEALKKFNTRDAKGLELVRKLGVEVAFMTTENSPIVLARAKKLGIEHCFTGVADKRSLLTELCATLAIPLERVAYVGDDVNDMEAMQAVGLRACPADAVAAIKATAHYISPSVGGSGAVRDVCDLIVGARK